MQLIAHVIDLLDVYGVTHDYAHILFILYLATIFCFFSQICIVKLKYPKYIHLEFHRLEASLCTLIANKFLRTWITYIWNSLFIQCLWGIASTLFLQSSFYSQESRLNYKSPSRWELSTAFLKAWEYIVYKWYHYTQPLWDRENTSIYSSVTHSHSGELTKHLNFETHTPAYWVRKLTQ